MAHEEVYGTRDRSYSAWHRRKSLSRYVGWEEAQTAHMIDLDASMWLEFDDVTKMPLVLVETAQDVGQKIKPYTVTRELAKRADLLAFCALYKLAEKPNPADPAWPDIESFRCKQIFPHRSDGGWKTFMPHEWAQTIVNLRKFAARKLDQPGRRLHQRFRELSDTERREFLKMLEPRT